MPARSLTLAAIRQPAFLYAGDGTIAEANGPAESIAGRPLAGCSAAAVVEIFEIRSYEGRPVTAGELPAIRVLAGEEAVDVPLTITAADGRAISVLVTASPIRENGRVVGALSIWQDVSTLEQERAGAALLAVKLETQQAELSRTNFELDRQRRLLDGILAALPHRISVWDREQRLLWANEQYAVERGHLREAMIQRSWRELEYDPTVIGPLSAEILGAVSAGKMLSREIEIAGPLGMPWLSVKAVPVFEDSVLIISEDVTERKRAEQALRESAETVRALINSPTDMSLLLDTNGTILAINDNYATLLGRPARDLAGESAWEVMPTGDVRARRSHFDRAVETRRIVRVEEQKDGRWWDTIINPILSDGGEVGRVAIIAREITSLKRAEEAAQESLERLSVAQAAARAGFWDWDAQSDVLTWSPELFDLFELPPASGQTFDAWLAIMHPDDREGATAATDRSIREHLPLELEYRAVLPGGAVRWISTLGDTTYDSEGRPLRMAGICVDITERKRAEDALRESEARYRRLFEDDITGNVVVAPDGRILDCNPAFARIFGFASVAEARSSSMIETYISPGDREARIVRLRDERRIENEEGFRRRRDGRRIHVVENVIGDFDDTGELVQVRGYIQDDTDRYRAEEALREDERRHAFLLGLGDRLRELSGVHGIAAVASELVGRHLGANGVVYCEVDRDGECATVHADWNDGTVPPVGGRFRMDDFGIGDLYRRGEVRRTSDVTTALPEDEAGEHCALRIQASLGVPVMRGGTLSAVLAVHSARPRDWTDAEVELVREAGDRIWTAAERARAEEAQREREQTMQGIFRAAPVGIGMVSHRVISQANEQLCRMTGYASEELVGKDARIFYPSDEAYNIVGREKYAMIHERGVGVVETQWRTRSGATLDILLSSSPIDLARPNEDVVFNALDITRLRESERVLASYMDELRRSNDELQRFAYVASHDLQEPLRSIVSFAQLLERRYRGRLDADADEYIEFIVEGGNRMQQLILDLLQLSRVETKAKPPSPTDAGEVAADAIRLLETPIREAGATVTVGDLPRVMADAAQLVQVFTNLIGNALKYRREGVPPEVRVSAEREGPLVRFAVSDNGIGIEPEYYDRIFVIFQRLHTRDEYEGTGIGLAVVRKIIERHGGRVEVESTPGEGSTFFFTLPAA